MAETHTCKACPFFGKCVLRAFKACAANIHEHVDIATPTEAGAAARAK
jgi:hypothetical protein